MIAAPTHWFEKLFGFAESSNAEAVRAKLEVQGTTLRSLVNDREYVCGQLEIPTLANLRSRVEALRDQQPPTGDQPPPSRIREVVGDVQSLHLEPTNAGAVFQAASQFNLLEMANPNVTPEAGISGYEYDHTQGPACAIAAGAGTVLRNYFVPLGNQIGQTRHTQIDCLADLGNALGNTNQCLWEIRNGYALATRAGLREITQRLDRATKNERDALRGLLRIGVHWNVEVTLEDAGHQVTQVYGSALPVAYGEPETEHWESFARLVLEASYEAVVCVALLNAATGTSNKLFLTLLGGGVFGNREAWILDAIERAFRTLPTPGLEVGIVSFGRSRHDVQELVAKLSGLSRASR